MINYWPNKTLDRYGYGWYATLLIILLLSDGSSARRRIWQGKVAKFEESSTWKNEQRPCSGDSVQMQQNRTILLSQHQTLSDLAFAPNSIIIMNEGSSINLIASPSEATLNECPGRKVSDGPLIASIKANSWFDPENWMTEPEIGQVNGNFYLDSERIPCNGDDIEIASGQTSQIDISSTLKEPIRLRSLKGGQSNEMAWATGTFLTVGQDILNSLKWPCDASYGCKCGNDRKEVMDELCQHIKMEKAAACQDAISLPGRCHPVCGSVVSIEAKNGDALIDIAKRVRSAMERLRKNETAVPPNVADYISITYDNIIQAIFIPSSDEPNVDRQNSNKEQSSLPSHRVAANSLVDQLKKDGYMSWTVSQSLLVNSSGSASTEDHSHDKYITDVSSTSTTTSTAGIAGISIGSLIMVILLIAGVWLLWHRRRQLPFSFRHFGQEEEPLEMDSGPNFVNPLYGPASDVSRLNDAANYMMEKDMDIIQDSFIDFSDDDKAVLAENEF